MIKADNGIIEYDGSKDVIRNNVTAILIWSKDFLGKEVFETILKETLIIDFKDIQVDEKKKKFLRTLFDSINKISEEMCNEGVEDKLKELRGRENESSN